MPLAIKINPKDNVVVALHPIAKGTAVPVDGASVTAVEDIPQGHKMAIAAIKASGQERALPQYDNDQALMTELDKLMAATLQYEVDCTEGTTQEGYLVLRPVTLTYQTASYAQSRQIIDALSASANVNFLSNVDVQYDADKAQYKTVLHLIFFELMP